MNSLRSDQVVVTLSAVIWVVGTLIGTGLVGSDGGVAEQGEGLFSDTATLIAPAGPAFSIWSVIYVFLAGYVLWQWLPGNDDSAWAARTRLPAAASLALNGIWLLVVFAGWVLVSVLVIAGIAASLGVILRRTADLPDEGWWPRVLVSVTFGLYLGWICVATCANVALWLVDLGVPAEGTLSTATTVGVLLMVVGLVAFLFTRTTDRVLQTALGAAVVWGTGWITAGRLDGDPTNEVVGYAAGATALLVVAAWGLLAVRQRVSHA
ncbi:tryptophan-rich sensory protein [Ornithinimicrobium sp. F0845]|uniref:tryptophan-rich sensory protein n=1 Tax=Ornithinimicrobium sp. F0845 TaxID=2926412 RepID=UPI001FF2ED11|nr:tryptophan-rich sensory protein [Ornithinimicrobium sp. F0845]MCK0113097.1 tryptophan-rich sensory protein [Ornithinimicrobium sp. F0845]